MECAILDSGTSPEHDPDRGMARGGVASRGARRLARRRCHNLCKQTKRQMEDHRARPGLSSMAPALFAYLFTSSMPLLWTSLLVLIILMGMPTPLLAALIPTVAKVRMRALGRPFTSWPAISLAGAWAHFHRHDERRVRPNLRPACDPLFNANHCGSRPRRWPGNNPGRQVVEGDIKTAAAQVEAATA